MTAGRLLLAAAVLALLTGCTSPREAKPTATGPTATSSPSPSTPPALPMEHGTPDASGFYNVCTGSSFPGAPAYTGPGLHPVEPFTHEDGHWVYESVRRNPDSPLAKYRTTAAADVQLVACIERADGPQLHACGTYLGLGTGGGKTRIVTVEVRARDYTINLFEARTARLVAGPITVRGEKDTECPKDVNAGTSQQFLTIWTGLTDTQIVQALAQYLS